MGEECETRRRRREGHGIGGWSSARRRQMVLCSATIREDVQKLAGTALVDPIVIKATQDDTIKESGPIVKSEEKFTPPSQLTQKYVVVPLKLRLVTLVALLRSLLTQSQSRKGTKIIVFLSCTDSVDFHWNLLGGTSMDDGDFTGSEDEASSIEDGDDKQADRPRKTKLEKIALRSTLLPDTSISRLHGSPPLQTRMASLRGFSSGPKGTSNTSPMSSILLCTSVASRGLDLPLVRAVIQYDLPTEGGATEYVHRVGRTVRVGQGGEACGYVAPSEAGWVEWVTERMDGVSSSEGSTKSGLEAIAVDPVLKKGFGGKGSECEDRATEAQLSFERWALKDDRVRQLVYWSYTIDLYSQPLRMRSMRGRRPCRTSEHTRPILRTKRICSTFGVSTSGTLRRCCTS